MALCLLFSLFCVFFFGYAHARESVTLFPVEEGEWMLRFVTWKVLVGFAIVHLAYALTFMRAPLRTVPGFLTES